MSDNSGSFGLLRNRPFVVLSTVSNGIDVEAEVIDIAIVNSGGEVLFNALVKPQQLLQDGVSYPHRIQNQQLMQALPWTQLHAQIDAVLQHKYCVMWHCGFHLRMLLQTLSRYGLPDDPLFDTAGYFCAMLDYKRYKGMPEEGISQNSVSLKRALNMEKQSDMLEVGFLPGSALLQCFQTLQIIRRVMVLQAIQT